MKDIEGSWKNTLVLVFRSDFICVVFWLYLILTLPMGVAIWEPSLAFRAASSVQLVRCRHAPAAFAQDEKLLEQGQISIGVWYGSKLSNPRGLRRTNFVGSVVAHFWPIAREVSQDFIQLLFDMLTTNWCTDKVEDTTDYYALITDRRLLWIIRTDGGRIFSDNQELDWWRMHALLRDSAFAFVYICDQEIPSNTRVNNRRLLI